MKCLFWLACCALVGCGPALTVRHDDFTSRLARLQLDGGKVRELAYGDNLTLRVDPGVHELQVTDPNGNSRWLGPTKIWLFFVDGDVAMTLEPPESAMPLPASPVKPLTPEQGK